MRVSIVRLFYMHQHHRALVVGFALLITLVAGMFVFAYLKKTEIVEAPTVNTGNKKDGEVKYASITRINAKHFYSDGTHTLVGEIAFPTPCDLLESSVRVAESMPEQVTIDFAVINTAEVCAQQETSQRFKVEVRASEFATFTATLDGVPVELNLMPSLPGESPDDFELYIKG
jgi:hypothetical protein